MNLQMIGCSHHSSSVAVRERLAFDAVQTGAALELWRERFPGAEAVLLSTCNRTELYTAAAEQVPSQHDMAEFLTSFHGLSVDDVFDELFAQHGAGAVRHLFTVASSLDSMVVGEAQILAQVKQAYELASRRRITGPITHDVFQTALRVAKRVASETSLGQRRVSIPSVAVADFAKQLFEDFADKQALVIGAGEMGEETLRYLVDEGVRDITVINRTPDRATQLAERWQGRVEPWEGLDAALIRADLVISTTAAAAPIYTAADFRRIERQRQQRPLFILDLAVPRDFDPAIGDRLGVYLYSIDDLERVCEANRLARAKDWPAAERIIDEETAGFMAQRHHRQTAPIIRLLRDNCDAVKEEELRRLFNKLSPHLDERTREEIRSSFDRLVNKFLHSPLESLRDEAQQGPPQGLLDALRRLFRLRD